jgi:hypothetical protein
VENATTDNQEANWWNEDEHETSLKVTFNLSDNCIAILRRNNYISKNKNTIVYINQYSDYHFMNDVHYN